MRKFIDSFPKGQRPFVWAWLAMSSASFLGFICVLAVPFLWKHNSLGVFNPGLFCWIPGFLAGSKKNRARRP